MQTNLNEKKLLATVIKFSIDKKESGTRAIIGAQYYDKDMKDFEDFLDLKLNKINSNFIHAKEIQDGFRVIMRAKYHNNMGLAYQIILGSNMDKLFADYLKWVKGFNGSEKFYDTLAIGLDKFVNSCIEVKSKLEDYLDLSEEPKQIEAHKEFNNKPKGQVKETTKKEKESKMENKIIDVNFKQVRPVESEKEEEISKEQIKDFIVNTKDMFKDTMDMVMGRFNKVNLKPWQIACVVANLFKMVNNTKSILYTSLSELLDQIFEGMPEKKDLVFDSVLALLEDNSISDFATCVETQMTKDNFIKLYANIIKNFDKIKFCLLNSIPELLDKVLDDDVVEKDQKVEILLLLNDIIKGDLFDKNNIINLIKEDVQKGSDNPEEDLQKIKELSTEVNTTTGEKEAAQTMNPVQENMNNQQQQIKFTPVFEPSDANDYEKEDGFIPNGNNSEQPVDNA